MAYYKKQTIGLIVLAIFLAITINDVDCKHDPNLIHICTVDSIADCCPLKRSGLPRMDSVTARRAENLGQCLKDIIDILTTMELKMPKSCCKLSVMANNEWCKMMNKEQNVEDDIDM